jgi:predicted RNase H-like HicB family nuclease
MEWEELDKHAEDKIRATQWMTRNLFTLEEVSFMWALTEAHYRGMIQVLKEDPHRHEKLIKKLEKISEYCLENFKLHSYSDAQEKLLESYKVAKLPSKEEIQEYKQRARDSIDWDDATNELNKRLERLGKEFVIPIKFTAVTESCEEGGYHVFCKELQGVHSQGETLGEAVKNIQDALQEIIQYRVSHRSEP